MKFTAKLTQADVVAIIAQHFEVEPKSVLADRGLPILASEWSEDPEAMPEDHREALLDAVRSRADDWVADYPENRAARVHECLAPKLAPRFLLPLHEMRMLCEEAGYPT